jgi:signal peptidase
VNAWALRRCVGSVAWLAVMTAIVALGVVAVVVVVGLLSGYRSFVVHSGSMEPTLAAGDLIISRRAHPTALVSGDIVTFNDATRDGTLVTHRVVSVAREASSVAVVTRGDANTGVERWSVAADGTVGVLRMHIRGIGRTLQIVGSAPARVGLLLACLLLVGQAAVRRIWAW